MRISLWSRGCIVASQNDGAVHMRIFVIALLFSSNAVRVNFNTTNRIVFCLQGVLTVHFVACFYFRQRSAEKGQAVCS